MYQVMNGLAAFDFEIGVLRTTDADRSLALYARGGNQPSATISDEGKQKIETGWIESLRNATPTVVPTVGGNLKRIAVIAVGGHFNVRRRLDLDAQKLPLELRNEVRVGAMTGRDQNRGPIAGQPFDRR